MASRSPAVQKWVSALSADPKASRLLRQLVALAQSARRYREEHDRLVDAWWHSLGARA